MTYNLFIQFFLQKHVCPYWWMAMFTEPPKRPGFAWRGPLGCRCSRWHGREGLRKVNTMLDGSWCKDENLAHTYGGFHKCGYPKMDG